MLAARRSERSSDCLASAMRKPTARPNGRVASASDTVTSTPAAISSPQPSLPKLSSVSIPSMGAAKVLVYRQIVRNRPTIGIAGRASALHALASAAIGVEREVLVVDFLVLAVCADGVDRGVELLCQLGLALADRDAGAQAMDFIHRRDGADDLAARSLIGRKPLFQHGDIVIGGVDAAVDEI